MSKSRGSHWAPPGLESMCNAGYGGWEQAQNQSFDFAGIKVESLEPYKIQLVDPFGQGAGPEDLRPGEGDARRDVVELPLTVVVDLDHVPLSHQVSNKFVPVPGLGAVWLSFHDNRDRGPLRP